MKNIPKSIIDQAYTYEEYRGLIDKLFANHKTTGPDHISDWHSSDMLNYTKQNLARMNRLDKKSRLTEATLQQISLINQPIIWLVITEGWCGDAAQIVPVLNHLAKANGQIELKFILRDTNLPIIDAFLTNGARAIPKILVLDANSLEVLTTWGPRPNEMQKMIMDAKAAAAKIEDSEQKKLISINAANDLHKWYAKDKTKTIQKEFMFTLVNS